MHASRDFLLLRLPPHRPREDHQPENSRREHNLKLHPVTFARRGIAKENSQDAPTHQFPLRVVKCTRDQFDSNDWQFELQ
jgi:hypothetical protein